MVHSSEGSSYMSLMLSLVSRFMNWSERMRRETSYAETHCPHSLSFLSARNAVESLYKVYRLIPGVYCIDAM